jgi:hypothetical protein
MNEREKTDLVKVLVELLRDNRDIRDEVFHLVCRCPNLVKQY